VYIDKIVYQDVIVEVEKIVKTEASGPEIETMIPVRACVRVSERA
jgi:hypothetical protein